MMNILKKVQRMVRMALHGRDMVKNKTKLCISLYYYAP